LVVAVVSSTDNDVFEGLVGGDVFVLGHVDDAFGSEGAFSVNVCCFGVTAALISGKLNVDGELMANLGFAGTEGAGEFCHAAGFEATSEEGVEFATIGGDAFNCLAFLPKLVGGFKTNAGETLSGLYDLLRCICTDASEAGEFFDGGCGDSFNGAEAAFFEFLGDGGSDAIDFFKF
jgi:hypothetical protein